MTLRQTDKHKKVTQPKVSIVNACPTDAEYLYYLLDVEGVTLEGSLLPAHDKANNNHNNSNKNSTNITFNFSPNSPFT